VLASRSLLFAALALGVVASGCATTPVHTTAQAVPAGHVELGGFGSGILYGDGDTVGAFAFAVGGSLRAGVTEWLDVGATADTTTGAMGDAKLELVDDEDVAVAIDLAAGGTWYGAFQARVPVLVDLPFGEGHRVTLGGGYQQHWSFAGLVGLAAVNVALVRDHLWLTTGLDAAVTFIGGTLVTQLAVGLRWRT